MSGDSEEYDDDSVFYWFIILVIVLIILLFVTAWFASTDLICALYNSTPFTCTENRKSCKVIDLGDG